MPCPSATRLSRRGLLSAAVGVPAAALSGCLADAWDELPGTRLTIATGNPGGVFDRYGDALATVLGESLVGVSVRTRTTNASVANLRLIAARDADIGFSLGDTASDAVRGTGASDGPMDIAALTRTYDSFVHLVVLAASPVREVTGLRGRRVGLGARGSGTRVIAERVIETAGLSRGDVTSTADTLEESTAALRTGDLDAFFFVSGLANAAIRELSEQVPIRLVDLGRLVADMTASYGTEYTPGPVPASTYSLPTAVDTVSVKNYVVVHPDLDDGVAYAVTRVMFEQQATINDIAPGIGQPNIGAAIFTSPLALHPGALRYYRERHA